MLYTQQIHRIEGLPVIQEPEIVSGAPVFEHTRVPVQTLFEYLADNYSLEEFLESFPSVSREAALKVRLYGKHRIEEALGL
jgi:uncharacterized protein (DUF433 family)